MRRLIFRKVASADLRGVAYNTRTRWGNEQASRYVAMLRTHIKSLREYPDRYPEFGDRYPGLRKTGCGRHRIFYLTSDDAVEIIRILHEAMDFDEHL